MMHVHDRGILHKDLRPQTIFIDSDCRLKIGGIGATSHQPLWTQTNTETKDEK